ncbi:MAG: type II secretion system major pseudopilin GspG [Candidatus Omnitrophica bacterium]|nr:type II secretion system major pseudopilin GspG [Candidatus Omnitrophota bacterium]
MKNLKQKLHRASRVYRIAPGQSAIDETQYGFTLIELMIVVIIIAALSAMVVPRLSNRSEQAKITVAEADINSNIGLALKLYKLDNGRYPSTEQGLKALFSKPSSNPVPKNWNGPYLESEALDPWKTEYLYKCPGAHNSTGYDLYSLGADGAEGSDDDIKNW